MAAGSARIQKRLTRASLGLTGYPQVDTLDLWYKAVNFGEKTVRALYICEAKKTATDLGGTCIGEESPGVFDAGR